MLIDFREIPYENSNDGLQDSFELFARDFLEIMGYEIIQEPFRGSDGKKDLIVSEIRTGIGGETTIKWLVSCKHKATSGRSVSDKDEPDIIDRIKSHQCSGFIGFFSTIASKTLSEKLARYKTTMESQVFDKEKIEKIIFESNKYEHLFVRYFPKSYQKYKGLTLLKGGSKELNINLLLKILEEKLPPENKGEIEEYDELFDILKRFNILETGDLISLIDRFLNQALNDDKKIAAEIVSSYSKGKGLWSKSFKYTAITTLDLPKMREGVFLSHCRLIEHMLLLAYGKNWTKLLKSCYI